MSSHANMISRKQRALAKSKSYMASIVGVKAKEAPKNVSLQLADKAKAAEIYAQVVKIAGPKSSVMDNYVDVKTGLVVQALPESATVSMLKTAARMAMGGKAIKMKLYAIQSNNSGAGANLANSLPVTPSAASEWASIAALYDLALCRSVKILYAVTVTGVNSLGLQTYAIGYDSTRNVSGSSIPDVMESPQHQTGALGVGTSAAPTMSTAAQSASSKHGGFREFFVHMQRQPIANASAVTGGSGIIPNFPGEWYETNNAATLAYSMGYVRFFAANLGGTNVITFNAINEYDMEFKERT